MDGNSVAITVPVKNTGKRDGTEIVQLYIRNLQDADGPLKALRAFQRVTLKAGEGKAETIRLNRESFEFWDAETNTMRVKPGSYELLYGNSSADKDLKRMTIHIK